MYFLNAAALADELGQGRLSERDKLKYFLGLGVVGLVTGQPGGILVLLSRPYGALYSGAFLGALLAGFLGCFRANERGDNEHFVERMICLAFPLSLWWWPLGWGLYAVWASAGPRLRPYLAPAVYGPYAGVLYSAAMYLAYYIALRHFIARAAGHRVAPEATVPA
jgi:hypothetical protein